MDVTDTVLQMKPWHEDDIRTFIQEKRPFEIMDKALSERVVVITDEGVEERPA